ncbi:hypothetical protein SPONL_1576 [uncultured Candidatus Thioglobus sp.]|nr:hypothetical protein SPONL_1576 [uncultured Candidatus Thioglobus sp.]
MMTTATLKKQQLTEFAEHIYKEQKADFVQDLAKRIEKSINIGMAQVESGESMNLEKSKQRLYKEFFTKFNNAKI